jgi:hypothetical protein
MNDKVARKFFDRRILLEAVAREEWALVIWMLPAYLMLTALLNRLTRQERFDRLRFVAAIILLFVENFEATLDVRTRYEHAAWSRELAFKYLLDCLQLIEVLLQNRDVYLGALGSHLVEHFFGLVRHFCNGHDRADYLLCSGGAQGVPKEDHLCPRGPEPCPERERRRLWRHRERRRPDR